jgi:hypothetical protein
LESISLVFFWNILSSRLQQRESRENQIVASARAAMATKVSSLRDRRNALEADYRVI